MWADETRDHTAIRVQDFRDATAVEFSLESDPPFFGMGEEGRFVNIWMWKSERQANIDTAFQDIDKAYPNVGIDAYPNFSASPTEQPTRHALTARSEPTFITGWGAENIMSNPLRQSVAEDLAAQGVGTLKAHPIPDQTVQAHMLVYRSIPQWLGHEKPDTRCVVSSLVSRARGPVQADYHQVYH
ncbi:hypothetical protein HYR99_09795 [Candidatus Poribacteria bacterium]|nr:hypothetical protein [Candidatus Poribacteria bacterium]